MIPTPKDRTSKDKLARYLLQNNREFDFNHLKALKAKKYVTKITV